VTLGLQRLGATIDGFAVEGGFDVEGGPYTSFNAFQSLGRTRPSLRSQATYEHLAELMASAASLGLDEVRLTLEWARLERRPDQRDEAALEHYARALGAARSAGLSTVVVLCDAVWPSWLGHEPWLSAWAPARFAQHARWVAARLEGLARAVVTMRSPNLAASAGWRSATRPPFRHDAADDELAAIDGMLLAHQLACDAIAETAPSLERALVLEVSNDYDDECLWRDVARGLHDTVVLAARRERYEREVARHGRGRRRMDHAVIGSLRSTPRWLDTAASQWWLAGSDPDLLCAVLADEAGADRSAARSVELSAGPYGWDAQLAVGVARIAESHGSPEALHLCGLVAGDGPLGGDGLLRIDQHNDAWTVSDPGGAVARRLGSLRR